MAHSSPLLSATRSRQFPCARLSRGRYYDYSIRHDRHERLGSFSSCWCGRRSGAEIARSRCPLSGVSAKQTGRTQTIHTRAWRRLAGGEELEMAILTDEGPRAQLGFQQSEEFLLRRKAEPS